MYNRTTLLSLFEKGENEFRKELQALSLPYDEERIFDIINRFFIKDAGVADYKDELTMQEIVMFNSVLKLINSQSKLFTSIMSCHLETRTRNSKDSKREDSIPTITKVSGASLVGGIAGGLLFGMNWGCVLFSVAGSALGIYLVDKRKSDFATKEKSVPYKLNVDVFINICKEMCQNIDSIISDYSLDIAKIRESYENLPKQTLGSSYKLVLDRIGNLLVASTSFKLPEKMEEEINLLIQTVKNYHCDILLYSEENKSFFDENESSFVEKPVLVKAAIIENGKEIERGEILVPTLK